MLAAIFIHSHVCNHPRGDLHHISLPQTRLNTLYEDTDLTNRNSGLTSFLRSIIRTINRCVLSLQLRELSCAGEHGYVTPCPFPFAWPLLTITLLLDSQWRKKKKEKMEDDQNDTVGHYRMMAIVAFLRGKNLGGDYCQLHIRRRCIMLEK